MKFEYEIVKYPSDKFEQTAYFCTADGECDLKGMPSDQITELTDLLNEKGSEGWELVQLSFGRNGVVTFWKRRL